MRTRVWSALVVALAVVVAVAAAPRAVEAQLRRPPPRGRVERADGTAKVYLGVSLLGAQPQGDFGRVVDDALGGQLEVTVPVARAGALRLHAEAGGMQYGHEHRTSCSPPPIGCRIDLDLNTDNAILFAGVGPEIALVGTLTPYANATLGVSDFITYSTLGTNHESFASTDHYHDVVLGGRIGGGVRFQVTHGRFPLLVDLGAKYHFNGTARYLIEGDVRDLPNGEITFEPRQSQANLFALQIGGAVGIGRHRAAERPRAPVRGRRGR